VIIALGMLAALTGCAVPSLGVPTPTVTRTASPAPASSTPAGTPPPTATTGTAAGCPANGGATPTGATIANAGDLDGDGRDDTVFYSATRGEFGITTASGATVTTRDPLAGPARHTGWAARIAGGAAVLVTADGRGAALFALQRDGGCRLGAVQNADGAQYLFDQEELRGQGTGVGCLREDGALQLGGYDAKAIGTDSGLFRVTFTPVVVSGDGRTATNGAARVIAGSSPGTGALVKTARGSTCLDAPIVGSDGE
jgi:hypothetical protein